MKVAHWAAYPGSGLWSVATSMQTMEKELGIDSVLCNSLVEASWHPGYDADIHVEHSHLPMTVRKRLTKPLKLVFVAHGTPEHCFQEAVTAGEDGAYAPGNPLMILQQGLKQSDAIVTFWPRHQAILQSMCDRHTVVDLVPMGVDTKFWASGVSKGKYQGEPSVFSAENCHTIKWPLDLVIAWPWVYKELTDAYLHLCYLPWNQHRYWFPLATANGAYYKAHMGAWTYPHEELRNIFRSIDFQIGLVRYGDFNRMSLEANAAGATTISYQGNPYADYWVPEGDQRILAQELVKILRGDVKPRAKESVPDIYETATAMQAIYERELDRVPSGRFGNLVSPAQERSLVIPEAPWDTIYDRAPGLDWLGAIDPDLPANAEASGEAGV